MASEGPNLPGVGFNSQTIGTLDWDTPANIQSDIDVASATVIVSSAGGTSRYLLGRAFGFAVPTTATINGIEYVLGARLQIGIQGNVTDNSVRLFIGGVAAGDNKAIVGNYTPNTPADVTYGGAADLWGLTPTPAQINAADFGVGYSFVASSVGEYGLNLTVDWVTVTVYYTEAAGSASQTISMGRWVTGERRKPNRLTLR
jgi:large repetitive protein